MTREKKVRFEGLTLLYGRIMGKIGERRYKYLGIIEANLTNKKEMNKIQVSKKRRLKLMLKSTLN